MAEYIDIDAPVVVTDTRGRERETTVRHILEINKGVYTAADVRPVVLCRDCKNNYNTCLNHGRNEPMCDFTDRKLRENDFCSRGEKREES